MQAQAESVETVMCTRDQVCGGRKEEQRRTLVGVAQSWKFR